MYLYNNNCTCAVTPASKKAGPKSKHTGLRDPNGSIHVPTVTCTLSRLLNPNHQCPLSGLNN